MSSMNRTVSLPDLISQKRRQSCASLSEGFAGGNRSNALSTSALNFAPKPGVSQHAPDQKAAARLALVLPGYYRTRQFMLSFEKNDRRCPRQMLTEIRSQEQAIKAELRALHPLLFQRFDDNQMERLLRAMPFLRLSEGRWVFGGDTDSPWPAEQGERVFLLFSGRVACYPDESGTGEKTEANPGQLFGEQHLCIGDEVIRVVGQDKQRAARCEVACMVGMLSMQVLEIAYADRYFGNKRIAQVVRYVPALARICQADVENAAQRAEEAKAVNQNSRKISRSEKELSSKESGAIITGLNSLSKIATLLTIRHNQDVLTELHDPIDNNLLIVQKGALQIRGDVELIERMDAREPRKVRLRIGIEKAEKLAGDSIFDKLDPYVICKLGETKRFRTHTINNAGVNAKWNYQGVHKYDNEKVLEFIVMDYDTVGSDDLCGNAQIPVDELEDGGNYKIRLYQPKQSIFKAEASQEVPAGWLYISVKWDYEQISALQMEPTRRMFKDQVLFTINEQECWGAEHLMLDSGFRKSLEGAAHALKYNMHLGEFKVIAASPRGVDSDMITLMKVTKPRFIKFVKEVAREKHFQQACRVSSLQKQAVLRDLAIRLVHRWEQEELARRIADPSLDATPREKLWDPDMFRTTFLKTKMHISVRNALNLVGGGWFDKLDPYAIIRFRGSKSKFMTSVLEDAGADPQWNDEGSIEYNGEKVLEITVYDYDKYSKDDLIGTAFLQVEQFCNGFEGTVALMAPGEEKKKKKKKTANSKQMQICIGIQWDPPKDPNAGKDKDLAGPEATMTRTMERLMGATS